MPRPKKASAQAKAKQQSGQPTFTHVENNISEDGSMYNDSGEEQIGSESDEDTETEDTLECITSLQRLYAVFLPPHLKQQNQAKKVKVSNRSIIYQKNSHTSNWQKRKYWGEALKGCQKVDSFFLRKRSHSPSPDAFLISDSEIVAKENFHTLEEDPAHVFANKMGLAFDDSDFYVKQLENELSAKEPLLIPEDELDEAYWLVVNDKLDLEDSELTRDSEVPPPEAPETSAA